VHAENIKIQSSPGLLDMRPTSHGFISGLAQTMSARDIHLGGVLHGNAVLMAERNITLDGDVQLHTWRVHADGDVTIRERARVFNRGEADTQREASNVVETTW
jgi:hypothetical protein